MLLESFLRIIRNRKDSAGSNDTGSMIKGGGLVGVTALRANVSPFPY
jgi:hypothetical protein